MAIAFRGGLWRDEALFLSVVRLPSLGTMLDFLRMNESHPPLFYVAMRVWIFAFGDTDRGSLILPIAFGVALVPIIYFVGSRLFSERTGLLAAMLAAFFPALVEYSAVARPYSLMPLLTLLSTFTLIRGLQRGQLRTWTAYVPSTSALLYTHNWGWLVLTGEWIAVLVVVSSQMMRRRGVAREWLTAQAVICVVYIPWAPAFLYQIRHAGHGPSIGDMENDFVVSLATSASQFIHATFISYSPVGPPATRAGLDLFFLLPILLLLAGQYLHKRAARLRPVATSTATRRVLSTDTDNRIALACLVIVPTATWLIAIVLSRRSDVMMMRCLVMLAPCLLLGLAYWLERPDCGMALLLSRAAMVTLILTYATGSYEISRTVRSNARELASAVSAQTQATDLVVITPEWLASSFNRYYGKPVEQIAYPHFGREERISFADMLPRFTNEGAARLVRARINQARKEGRRVWFIVDRHDVLARPPDRTRFPQASTQYALVALERTHQLLAQLDSLYGSPDTSAVRAPLPSRYEDLRAFLYSPGISITKE